MFAHYEVYLSSNYRPDANKSLPPHMVDNYQSRLVELKCDDDYQMQQIPSKIAAPRKEKSQGLTKGVGLIKPSSAAHSTPSMQTTVRNSYNKVPTSKIELTRANPQVPQNMILHHSVSSSQEAPPPTRVQRQEVIFQIQPEDVETSIAHQSLDFQDVAQETMRKRVVQVAKIEMIRRTTSNAKNKDPVTNHEKIIQQYRQERQKSTAQADSIDSRQTILFNQGTQREQQRRASQVVQEPIIIMSNNFNSAHSPRNVNIRDTTSYESERSSMFNEKNPNTAAVTVRQQKTETQNNLEKTIQKVTVTSVQGIPARGMAFLAGQANLNLMENLNAVAAQNPSSEGNRKANHIQSVKIHQFLELNLRMQSLTSLQPTLFNKNIFLRTVDIRNNSIKELPESLCELSLLWKLRVDYNLLEHLPSNIGKLERLEALTASCNKLKNLPPSLYQLTEKLTMLQINDNMIRRLPGQIGELKKLTVLMLHNNLLKSLPCEIFSLQGLTEFSLEWFSYLVPPVGKVLKDERGKLLIKDILKFASLMHDLQGPISERQQLYFVNFIAYFNKCTTLEHITQTKLYQKGRTIMHYICLNGHLHLLKDLLASLPPDPSLLNAPDTDGTTPLTLAFKNKQTALLIFLLQVSRNPLKVPIWLRQQRLDLSAVSQKYGVPLNLAIKNHDLKIARLILASNKHGHNVKFDVNQKDQDSNNAMHLLMAYFGHDSKESAHLALMLLRRGIDPNSLNKNELSPVQIAIKSFQAKALKFVLDFNLHKLCKEGSLFDLNMQCGKNQWNALHYAVFNNNLSAVMLLVQYAHHASQLGQVHIRYLWDRDSEGRKAQDLCPYNSPLSKIISKAQKELLMKIASKERTVLPASDNEKIAQNYINRRFATVKPVLRKVDRASSTASKDMAFQQFDKSTLHNYHLAAQSMLQRTKSNERLNQSRAVIHMNNRNQSVIVTVSRGKAIGDFMNQSDFKQSSAAKQQSPRLFQKVPPLPPKRLMLINPEALKYNQGNVDLLMDMEELMQSRELQSDHLDEQTSVRFMSHQMNFDTHQDIKTTNRDIFNESEDESPELDLTSLSQTSSESDLDEVDIVDGPAGVTQDKALGSIFQSQRPKSYKEVQTTNAQMYLSAPNSFSRLSQCSSNGGEKINANPTFPPNDALHTPTYNGNYMAVDMTEQQTYKGAVRDLASLKSSSDEEDGVCDAGDEEPEAGSLGHMIANKINKFENNQILQEVVSLRSKIGRDALLRLIEDINEVKRLYKVTAAQSEQRSFKSRDYPHNRVSELGSAQRYGDDEEGDEGNVFDTLNQGPFLANQIPSSLQYQRINDGQYYSCQSTPVNLMHRVSNHDSSSQQDLMEKFASSKELIMKRGSLTSRNQDCVAPNEKIYSIYTRFLESFASLTLPRAIQQLHCLFLRSFTLDGKCQLQLSAFNQAQMLMSLLKALLSHKEGHMLAIHLLFLISSVRSKAFIPLLEKLSQRMKRLKQSQGFTVYQLVSIGEVWLCYELENCLQILTTEAMVESKMKMERENQEIKNQREKSRQRLKRTRSEKTLLIEKADISDDESAGEERPIPGLRSTTNNSSVILYNNLSIKEVPEFVARLQKSPSTSSLSRVILKDSQKGSDNRYLKGSNFSILAEKSMSVLEQNKPLSTPLLHGSSSVRQFQSQAKTSIVIKQPYQPQTPKAPSHDIVQAFQLKMQQKPFESGNTQRGPTSLSVFKNRPYKFQQARSPPSDGQSTTLASVIAQQRLQESMRNNPFVKRSRSPQQIIGETAGEKQKFIKISNYFPHTSRVSEISILPLGQVEKSAGVMVLMTDLPYTQHNYYQRPSGNSAIIPNQKGSLSSHTIPVKQKTKQVIKHQQMTFPADQISPRFSKHNVSVNAGVLSRQQDVRVPLQSARRGAK